MRNIPTVLLLLLLLLLFEIERVKEILNGRNKREDRVYKVVALIIIIPFLLVFSIELKRRTQIIIVDRLLFSLTSPQSKIIFLDN
jgi:hypothetical protein